MGHMHPESPMRLEAINAQLQAQGLMLDLTQFDAKPAELNLIERAHPRQYVHEIEQTGLDVEDGDLIPLDGDTSMGPGSLRAALLAAPNTLLGTKVNAKAEDAAAPIKERRE